MEQERRYNPAETAEFNAKLLAHVLNFNLQHDNASGPEEEFFAHQYLAQRDIIDDLAEGVHEGYSEMATGTGKTYIMSKITQAARQAGLRVLVLSPTVQVADQNIGRDGKRGLGKFTKLLESGEVAKHYNGSHAKPTDQVVFSTYQSFLGDNFDKLGDFDVILGDEAHRGLGEQTSRKLRSTMPAAVKLGFTATEKYGANKSVDQIFGKCMHRLGLRESIENGITAPMRNIVYKTDETIAVLDPQLHGFSRRELMRMAELKARNNAALDFAQSFVQDGRQGIIKCVPGDNLSHARFMARALAGREITKPDGTSRRIRTAAIGSHLDSDTIRSLLQDFEAGKIDVLTYVDMLNEGWDSTAASFAVDLCPTESPVEVGQTMGRIARPNKDGRESIYVNFYDNSRKQQVTSLHVLGEEVIEHNRVIGERRGETGTSHEWPSLNLILTPWIYSRISDLQGSNIADIYLKEREQYGLFRQYERILASEGMPAELDPTMQAGAIGKKILAETVAEMLLEPQEPGVRPLEFTLESIVAYAMDHGISPYRQSKVTEEHVGPAFVVATTQSFIVPPETAYNPVDIENTADIEQLQQEIVDKGLATLSDREQGVVLARNGFTTGKQQSLDAVGMAYGVTGARVRQIERRAMSKLQGSARYDLQRALRQQNEVVSQAPGQTDKGYVPRGKLWRISGIAQSSADKILAEAWQDGEKFADNLPQLPNPTDNTFKTAHQDLVRTIKTEIIKTEALYERTLRQLFLHPNSHRLDARVVQLRGYLKGLRKVDEQARWGRLRQRTSEQ